MTSLILGEVRGTKNRIVFVDFQSECYVKISSTKNDVYGAILTPLKIKYRPKAFGLDLKSSPGGLITVAHNVHEYQVG